MSLHAEHMKPIAHAPLAAPVAAPAPWAAFEAPTAEGTMRLWVHDSVRHAADAAVALDSCTALLDALDDWLGFAPSWRWCAPGTPSGGVPPHARAQWQRDASGPATCRLELPWSLLRQISAPAAPLAAQLHWSPATATLVLEQMQLDDAELECLEPGGAVLLPASMAGDWPGWLRAADESAAGGTGLPVRLAGPWQPQPLPTGAHAPAPAPADGAVYEVRLSLPRPFDAAELAGWQSAATGEPEARASLWRCAVDGGSARFVASGALMPWGDGWALHLETVAH